MMLEWQQADRELRPEELTESDGEDGGEQEQEEAKDEQQGESESREGYEVCLRKENAFCILCVDTLLVHVLEVVRSGVYL